MRHVKSSDICLEVRQLVSPKSETSARWLVGALGELGGGGCKQPIHLKLNKQSIKMKKKFGLQAFSKKQRPHNCNTLTQADKASPAGVWHLLPPSLTAMSIPPTPTTTPKLTSFLVCHQLPNEGVSPSEKPASPWPIGGGSWEQRL